MKVSMPKLLSRVDEVIKRLLKMPPKPHSEMKVKKKTRPTHPIKATKSIAAKGR
jgi:hypothetical protein